MVDKLLSGLRILDVTNYLAGPFASLLLAGLGAEVIKVENPEGGDPTRRNPPFANPGKVSFDRQGDDDLSLLFLKRNRGKKSITLNLKSAKGKDIFKGLVQKVDVVLENFAPGVMARLGLDYPVLKEVNPKIIYCSIAGFGQSGPYRDQPALDFVVQAMSGVMAVTGHEDGPPLRSGLLVGDQVPPLYALIGILSAIIERQRTGKGRAIDISMQDCLFFMIMDDAWDLTLSQGLPVRTGNRLSRLVPFNAYSSKDGYLVICTVNDEQWLNLLTAMGREDLKENPKYRHSLSRVKNSKEVDALVREWVEQKTSREVLEILRRNRVPCGPVLEIQDVLNDPQIEYRKMIADLKHPVYGKVRGVCAADFPIKFSDADLQYDRPAPLLGQNNQEIYSEFLGYDEEKLSLLKSEGVI